MTIVTKWFKEQAKTVAAFAAAFIGNMIVSLLNGTTLFPQTKDEWVQYLLTSFGAAVAAYLARNKITQKQLDADDHVLGGLVVDQKVTPTRTLPPTNGPTAGPYVNPFPEPTV